MFETLSDILNSEWLRIGGYGMVALYAIWIGLGQRRWAKTGGASWPSYWFVSAIILMTLAVLSAVDVGHLMSQIGRDQASSGGWYGSRRTLQVIIVVVVAGACVIGARVTTRRLPEPRSQYRPHLLALSSLVGLAGVRVVSLHPVDTLLYRRTYAGVQGIAVVEVLLLVFAVFASVSARRAILHQTPSTA